MRYNKRGLRASNPRKWFRRNRVNIPRKKEVIWEPLYDTLTYPSGGTPSLIFFQDQIGNAGKTLEDTNMDLAGALPKGKAFNVTGIQVAFYFEGSTSGIVGTDNDVNFIDDIRAFAENGSLTLRIQSKDYLRQAPLGKFPPVDRMHAEFSASGTNASNVMFQYWTTAGREFVIRDLLLESNQNFSVELRDLPALPSGIDAKLVVTLNGYLARNAQ